MRVKHNEEQIRNIERKLQRVETMDIPKNKIEYKMTNFNRVEIIKQDNLKNRVETRIQTRIEKIKKIKKIKYEQKFRIGNTKSRNYIEAVILNDMK